jgi:L-fuconate dehydratase
MKITKLSIRDIRFPTPLHRDGSDALNQGDYSATYVVLETGTGLEGNGLTFTNCRGNEIVVAAVHALIKPESMAEFEFPTSRFWRSRQ